MLITFKEFVGAHTSFQEISQHSASQFIGENDYVSIRTALLLGTKTLFNGYVKDYRLQ